VECNGNEEVNGNGNEGCGQATATAIKRAMVTATRVAGNKKAMATVADGNKEGEQVKATRATAMAMATATTVATCYIMRNFGTYFTGTYVFLLVPFKSACCTILLGIEIIVLEIQSHC
jgi:hypothetical protein